MTRRQIKQRDERGFAMLIVFLMAAAVAVMLYRQLPRVAFESQRDKEETLIDRGEQYKRAIKLYYVAFGKFPTKIEDLESTNNKRYLRHRFVDPMTGKDEWRLIHVNAGGMLTDSLVEKPPGPDDGKNQLAGNTNTTTNPGGFGTNTPLPGTNPAVSGTNPGSVAPPDVNAAVLRRPSDGPMVPGSGMNPNPINADPNDPRYWPPISLQPAPQPGQPNGQPGVNQPFPGQQNGGQQFQAGGNPQFPGQQFPGQQYPGQQLPGQQFGGQQYPVQPYPGVNAQYPGQQYPGQPLPGQPFGGQQQYQGQFPVQTPQFNGQPIQGIQPSLPPGVLQSGISGQIFPVQPGVPPVPGMPALPGQPGFNPQGGAFGPDGQWVPNNPGASNPGGQPGTQPGFPQQPQFPQQGTDASGGTGNSAIPLINNMLRTPRQAPPTAPATLNTQGPGAGLVGVASTYEGPSIKVYQKRQKYNEWEFVLKLGAPNQGQPPPNNPLGTQPGTQPGTPQVNPSPPGQLVTPPAPPNPFGGLIQR